MGDEVEFLPADRLKSFLQDRSITLGVINQQIQSTKYNQFTISLQYLKENMKDEVDFLPADKCWRIWYYQFRCVWLDMPKLPKITNLLFLDNMLRKKWVMQLIFYMQISMKACCKLIIRLFDGYGQAFPSSQKSNFAMSLQYP